MTGDVVFNQLMAVKYSALALAQNIDALVQAMQAESAATPSEPVAAPSAPQSAPAEDVDPDAPCTHPLAQRIPLPVMGKKKFKCMDCKQDVEDSE